MIAFQPVHTGLTRNGPAGFWVSDSMLLKHCGFNRRSLWSQTTPSTSQGPLGLPHGLQGHRGTQHLWRAHGVRVVPHPPHTSLSQPPADGSSSVVRLGGHDLAAVGSLA